MTRERATYGVMAEFEDPTSLVNAARAAYEMGFRRLDAYTPFPIEELNDILHLHKNKLPLIVLCGGVLGALTGYLLQYFVTVIYFPINVAGRPLTILFGSISTVLGLLGLCGLPMPYHPVFNVPRFSAASRDRFFLCIEAKDPMFNVQTTSRFLESMDAKEVSEVAN